jgi:hypothetical protein
MKPKEQKETEATMRQIAKLVDTCLNANDFPKKVGFVLLVMPFDGPEGARTNYVSNVLRQDMIKALKEVTTRLEEPASPTQVGNP